MQPVELRPSIYWVGVNDRQTDLFEGLWTIRKEGISYNSYLINDRKKLIIDLSSKSTTDELLNQVQNFFDPSELDYLVINHLEPDHSGALKTFIRLAPKLKLIGTAKTKEMLQSFYDITENIQVVTEGEELDLGEHRLKFMLTPFVHWPETMMTYEMTQKILFSCDGFGCYGALNGTIYDDKTTRLAWYESQALRYFVNIVASYSKPVKNAIAKIEKYPLEIVAPSHGLIWRANPYHIIELYNQWADYANKAGDPAITIIYASMYGNTERIMEAVAQGIVDEGVPISIYNVSRDSTSEILPSLWLKRGVIVGAPTYEGKLFVDMVNLLEMARRKHIFQKICAGFGSHAWMGGGQRELNEYMDTLRWKQFGNFEFEGAASNQEISEARQFGADFAREILSG